MKTIEFLSEIINNIRVHEYPKIPKGSMTVGRQSQGIELEYDDGKQKFSVCCDESTSSVKNRDKCLEIIKAYLHNR